MCVSFDVFPFVGDTQNGSTWQIGLHKKSIWFEQFALNSFRLISIRTRYKIVLVTSTFYRRSWQIWYVSYHYHYYYYFWTNYTYIRPYTDSTENIKCSIFNPLFILVNWWKMCVQTLHLNFINRYNLYALVRSRSLSLSLSILFYFMVTCV